MTLVSSAQGRFNIQQNNLKDANVKKVQNL